MIDRKGGAECVNTRRPAVQLPVERPVAADSLAGPAITLLYYLAAFPAILGRPPFLFSRPVKARGPPRSCALAWAIDITIADPDFVSLRALFTDLNEFCRVRFDSAPIRFIMGSRGIT